MKAFFGPIGRVLLSSPVMTTVGMCCVIVAGLGGSAFLAPSESAHLKAAENIFMDERPYIFQAGQQSRSLPLKIADVHPNTAVDTDDSVKAEPADKDSVAMLSYEQIFDMLTFTRRPDPFAPIAPPGQNALLSGKEAMADPDNAADSAAEKADTHDRLSDASATHDSGAVLLLFPVVAKPAAGNVAAEPIHVAVQPQ